MILPPVIAGIDPSTEATGFTVFVRAPGATMHECVYVRVIEAPRNVGMMIKAVRSLVCGAFNELERADMLAIVETPEHYPHSPVDPADLIKVAVVAGACRALFGESESVAPKIWNGGVPKKITAQRVLKLLSPPERAHLTAIRAGIRHNASDAIGVALWKLGILRR